MTAGPLSTNPSPRRDAARLEAALAPAVAAAAKAALAAHRGRPGALLPILHALQDALGYVPPESLPLVAHELNLTRAEVHGVVTFYHHFRATPPGRHTLRLCRAEACQALGARALEAHAKRTLGIGFHETTADGAITLEPVYCLGNCGCGPSLLLDDDGLHARMTPDAFDALVESCRHGRLPAGEAVARMRASPAGHGDSGQVDGGSRP